MKMSTRHAFQLLSEGKQVGYDNNDDGAMGACIGLLIDLITVNSEIFTRTYFFANFQVCKKSSYHK